MTPAEALRNLIANNERDRTGHVEALREALQIVEQIERVREALDAGARNLSGVSMAAWHAVLATDGIAPWPAGVQPLSASQPVAATPDMTRAYNLLRAMTEEQRGLILCWFCNSCRRYVGPGDNCTCERDE